jgi:aspartyl/asparaginyl beta-hydroxylase (cupin superfamily)
VKDIWYYDKGKPYPENEPKYYEINNFPALAGIEEHWPELEKEVKGFIAEKDKSFQSNNYQDVAIKGGWSSLTFVFWGSVTSKYFYKKCPKLMSHLNKATGLSSLSLSLLSPNSSIAKHRGDTNAVIRCHLGIEVPDSLPICGLKVGEEEKEWQEGKWVLFNDAYIHSAWNNSNKRRIVLILDLIKPEFLHKKNSICAHILTYQIINNKLNRKKPFKESSFFVKHIVFAIVFAVVFVYRPIHNFIKT